jgi:hypothetical protein
MGASLPKWLVRQTIEDFDAVAEGFCRVESDLEAAGIPSVAKSIGAVCQALSRLRQDLIYAGHFLTGVIRRRKSGPV